MSQDALHLGINFEPFNTLHFRMERVIIRGRMKLNKQTNQLYLFMPAQHAGSSDLQCKQVDGWMDAAGTCIYVHMAWE